MDETPRTDEVPASRDAYEPPRVDELGNVDALTSTVTLPASAIDDS